MGYDAGPKGKITMSRVQYISYDKEILDGTPVIAGTRIPVERVSELMKQGYTEENIDLVLSGITKSTLRGVLYELTMMGIEKFGEIQSESAASHA